MTDEIYDELITSSFDGTYKDISKLLENEEALNYTVDDIVNQWGERIDSNIKRIVCPVDDKVFAAALAKRLGIKVTECSPYEGIMIDAEDLKPGDRVIIAGSAICGGSLYFSMYSLLEDMGYVVEGFAFIVEKVWHRGRYKLIDSITTTCKLGIVTAVKYGVTVGNFVRFDCRHNGLGIREFRVLSVQDKEIGVKWLDGPRPVEKKFPKERIIAISFNKLNWFKYRP